ADDVVDPVSQEVGGLPLALIAPLGTHENDSRHRKLPSTKRNPWRKTTGALAYKPYLAHRALPPARTRWHRRGPPRGGGGGRRAAHPRGSVRAFPSGPGPPRRRARDGGAGRRGPSRR